MKVYRAMRIAADGLPEVGPSARTLGVRHGDQAPHEDIAGVRPDDVVGPGGGGMSVAPDDPANLPRNRRPPEFGGIGKDPVWVIEVAELPPELTFRQDKPTHGLVETAAETTLADYEAALASTRERWKQVPPPASGGQT